jgi:hypothetical protein
MTTPYPFVSASAWDRIAFENQTFSGLARVEGAERSRKVDVPQRAGSDGAHLRIKHRELAELKITLVGWTPAHLAEMERFTELVFPNEASGRRHAPVGATHPALQFHDINVIFVQKVEGPAAKENGTFELTLSARQWRPPPPPRLASTPAATPIEQRPTAFQGVEQPRPPAPATTATPRRRT